jgi:hypothetical protein
MRVYVCVCAWRRNRAVSGRVLAVECCFRRFFSPTHSVVQIEAQKQVQQTAAAEAQARGRVEKVKNDLAERTRGLERAAASAEAAGSLIEANAAQVDACIVAINSQLATGIAWNELERLLEDERSRGAPIAQVRNLLICTIWVKNTKNPKCLFATTLEALLQLTAVHKCQPSTRMHVDDSKHESGRISGDAASRRLSRQ